MFPFRCSDVYSLRYGSVQDALAGIPVVTRQFGLRVLFLRAEDISVTLDFDFLCVCRGSKQSDGILFPLCVSIASVLIKPLG
jgi:hypothetical protein